LAIAALIVHACLAEVKGPLARMLGQLRCLCLAWFGYELADARRSETCRILVTRQFADGSRLIE
jgi:hypothetical protein